MSKILLQNRVFIRLLLGTHKEQVRGILHTLNKPQVNVLAEILFNLDTFPQNKSKTNFILKYKKILNKIIDKRIVWSKKRDIIEKNYKAVWELLLSVKPLIIKLLT